MNTLRQLREQAGCSQTRFADLLAVSHDTYRTWDSGRRRVPVIISKARRLCDTQCGCLLPLQQLAEESGIHVRTLRRGRTGRPVALEVQLAHHFRAIDCVRLSRGSRAVSANLLPAYDALDQASPRTGANCPRGL